MICPRCGWVMHLLNSREHNEYQDYLYQCQCGTTHLHIAPKSQRLSATPDWYREAEQESVS